MTRQWTPQRRRRAGPGGWVHKFLGDRKGNVSAILALCLIPVIGAVGVGTEASGWWLLQRNLQHAADTAVLAAATTNDTTSATNCSASTPGTYYAEGCAAAAAAGYGFVDRSNNVSVAPQYDPPEGCPPGVSDCYKVTISKKVPLYLTGIVGYHGNDVIGSNYAVKVLAVAYARKSVPGSKGCIVALDSSAGRAVDVSGNSTVTLTGCVVASNSTASDSVYVGGSGTLSTDCVVSAGGVQGFTGTCSMTGRTPDPFSSLPTPPASGTCSNTNGQTELSPGTYCSLNLSGNNSVKLDPGTYVFEGPLTVHGGTLSGSGVTIYMEGSSALVDMNGNGTVQLSAPTTGLYAGVLFFGDPSVSGGTNKFNGTSNSYLTGALYFPTQSVQYNGTNISVASGCTQIVADTISFSGNANFSGACSGNDTIPVMAVNVGLVR